ncbi:RluA family pseudouridine synthase [Facklamia hominis]|uniref:RluA family pseudouridine synthase n=1 Tax=Facklamia hominis TaxID=178214 RepID=UPI000C79C181|nr:RluA family pseudouridine synthase [Facklamia hominis]PKY93046.1 RluA family pseudouridine synthase [Facklamia hominis]
MELNWIYQEDQPMTIKAFLNQQKLPRAFMRDVKFAGSIYLNYVKVPIRFFIQKGDHLRLVASVEEGYDSVVASSIPIEIVYEDRDLLVINKPTNVTSIPSVKTPDSSIANRIKGYYQFKNYQDQVIHIVTRLDRDTTGLMLVAKHRLAHALMDRQVKQGTFFKFYEALSSRKNWPDHQMIDQPIARCGDSIITRKVDPQGQKAKTEYWTINRYQLGSHLRLRLHTGRTHQIRVHLAHEGGPLIGDDLYGGPMDQGLMRQALHCKELHFIHPFTQESMQFNQPLPQDMIDWLARQKEQEDHYGSI